MDNTTKWILRITSIFIVLGIGSFLFMSNQQRIKDEEERKRIIQENARKDLIERKRKAKIFAENSCKDDPIFREFMSLYREANETADGYNELFFSYPKAQKEAREGANKVYRKAMEYYYSCVKRRSRNY